MSGYGGKGATAGIAAKIDKYRSDIERLVRYLPWLESKNRQDISSSYLPDAENASANAFHVPVYDSTLLSFIRTIQETKFLDRNYIYIYRQKKIHTPADELKMIEETQIMEIENLGAVLSNYAIRGMAKSTVWNEGVSNGVFFATVSRMKRLLEFWTKPM